MTQITRAQLVAKLAKPGQEILNTLTAEKVHLLHMALGIAGEVAELTGATCRENFVEELGDLRFYVQGVLQGLGVEEGDLDVPLVEGASITQLILVAGDVVDQIKKFTVYNKPVEDTNILGAVVVLLSNLRAMEEFSGLTYEEVHTANVEKLSKRYPELKYSDASAQARADKETGQ
jgi:hypothetical protein